MLPPADLEGGLPVGGQFPTTQWSEIIRIQDADQREAALDALCRIYWQPLYIYLRRDRKTREDAEDIVQSFLARVSQRGDLEKLDPSRGRLRTFLLTALKNFVINWKEHQAAQRRGGGAPHLSLDLLEAENLCAADLADHVRADLAYDRAWARTILRTAYAKLQDEYRRAGQESVFATLSRFLDGTEASPGAYENAGQVLSMKPNTVAVRVLRLRQRLRAYALAEAAATVGSLADAESELRDLYQVLSAPT